MARLHVRCKDSNFSATIWQQPTLLSCFASSQHQLDLSQCPGARSMPWARLCSPYPPLLSKNSAEDTPSNPALWRPAVPWQDLSCFGLSIWLARTPPLLNTSFHISSSSPTAANQASQRQHISVFIICARDRWHGRTVQE